MLCYITEDILFVIKRRHNVLETTFYRLKESPKISKKKNTSNRYSRSNYSYTDINQAHVSMELGTNTFALSTTKGSIRSSAARIMNSNIMIKSLLHSLNPSVNLSFILVSFKRRAMTKWLRKHHSSYPTLTIPYPYIRIYVTYLWEVIR